MKNIGIILGLALLLSLVGGIVGAMATWQYQQARNEKTAKPIPPQATSEERLMLSQQEVSSAFADMETRQNNLMIGAGLGLVAGILLGIKKTQGKKPAAPQA